jgi:hypothetical protein
MGELRSAFNSKMWETDAEGFRDLIELIWKCETDYQAYIENMIKDVPYQYRNMRRNDLSINDMWIIFNGEMKIDPFLLKWVRAIDLGDLNDTTQEWDYLISRMFVTKHQALDYDPDKVLEWDTENYGDDLLVLPFEKIRLPDRVDTHVNGDFIMLWDLGWRCSLKHLKEIVVPASYLAAYYNEPYPEMTEGEYYDSQYESSVNDWYRVGALNRAGSDNEVTLIFDATGDRLSKFMGVETAVERIVSGGMYRYDAKVVLEFDQTWRCRFPELDMLDGYKLACKSGLEMRVKGSKEPLGTILGIK